MGCCPWESQEPDMTVVTEHALALRDPKLTVPDRICFQIICCDHTAKCKGDRKEQSVEGMRTVGSLARKTRLKPMKA